MPRIRWQTWLLVLLLVFVLFSMGMCSLHAGATTADPLTPSGPTSFSEQGQVVTDPATIAAVTSGAGCAGTLWTWGDSWNAKNGYGKIAYDFGPRYFWCGTAGPGGRVLRAGWSNTCRDLGGYFEFDGCNRKGDGHRNHTAFGYASVFSRDVWHYHFDYKVWTDRRTPSVEVNLYANGGVTGTVYYDA